jgi:S1-C subfamily serine protease
MRSFSTLVIQLVLAALVGYGAARYAQTFAVGNPLGVGQTVTQGIVSAVGRKGLGINPIESFIQTDAAINPGNSGGALVDTAGRLVGINSAILSRGGGCAVVQPSVPA